MKPSRRTSFKSLVGVSGITLIFLLNCQADSKVVLTEGALEKVTTIPGNFNTLEAILPALFALADQAEYGASEQLFTSDKLKNQPDTRDLIFYYRGVRVENDVVLISFTESAKPYFSGSVGFDVSIMKSILGTARLYQPNAKKVEIEIEGEIWRNEGA